MTFEVALPIDNDETSSSSRTERSSLLWISGNLIEAEEKRGKIVKALFYGFQVFYSFFIM